MNVVEIERWQIASRQLYRSQEARKSALDVLGQSFADASMNGDWNRANDVMLRAIAQGIEADSLIRSARTRMRREEGDLLSRYSAEDQARWRGILGGEAPPTWEPGMPSN